MDHIFEQKLVRENQQLQLELAKINKQIKQLQEKVFAYETFIAEELKGKQHKIDLNKNNRIDAEDFKILRKKKINESHSLDQLKKLSKIKLRGLKIKYENKIKNAPTEKIKKIHKDELKNIHHLLNKK